MAATFITNLLLNKMELEPCQIIYVHMAGIIAMFEPDLTVSVNSVLILLSLTNRRSFHKHPWWRVETGLRMFR